MEKYIVRVNGKEYEVEIEKAGDTGKAAEAPSQVREVKAAPEAAKQAPAPKKQEAAPEGASMLKAGAAGKVFKILKKAGDPVANGETVIILEAMKMEIPMVSQVDGTVNQVLVNEGQPVEAGDDLAVII